MNLEKLLASLGIDLNAVQENARNVVATLTNELALLHQKIDTLQKLQADNYATLTRIEQQLEAQHERSNSGTDSGYSGGTAASNHATAANGGN